MKISATIKKVFAIILSVVVVLGVVGGVLYFLPNEVTFKIYNAQAIAQKDDDKAINLFDSAGEAFPKWSLIAKNNSYGRLYKQQKYDELSDQLTQTIDENCNMESEKISEYCENIFYLQGLVQYRLGENKIGDEQNQFYQNAIDEFQKALVMNPDNKWAKENIDFILQKTAQQQQSGENQNQQNGQDGQEDQEGQEGQLGDEQDTQQGQDGEKNGQNKQDKAGEEGQNNEGDDEGGEDGAGESRLPQNIQDALEEAQKNMEQDQGQEGFNRSKSAAQRNNYRNQDPFEQMIQQFFGGSIGAIDGEKNFTQEIQNPNEKDW